MRFPFHLLLVLTVLLAAGAGCGNDQAQKTNEAANKTKVAPKTQLYYDPNEKLP